MIKLTILVDEPDKAAAEFSEGDKVFALDDLTLARLGEAFEIAANAARAHVSMEIELKDQPPYRRPDLTAEEIAEIDEEEARIRMNLGDAAADEYRASRMAGGGL